MNGLSSQSKTRIPSSKSKAPSTRTENWEKKLDRAVTSPSMRSIISPGVRALWKLMSSDRQCLARSRRNRLVAVQPTSAPL